MKTLISHSTPKECTFLRKIVRNNGNILYPVTSLSRVEIFENEKKPRTDRDTVLKYLQHPGGIVRFSEKRKMEIKNKKQITKKSSLQKFVNLYQKLCNIQ